MAAVNADLVLAGSFGDESDIKVVKASFPTTNGATSGNQAEELVLSSAICWENLMVRTGSTRKSCDRGY